MRKKKIRQEQEQDPTRPRPRARSDKAEFSATLFFSEQFTPLILFQKQSPPQTFAFDLLLHSLFTSNINKCYPNNSPLQLQ
jgi:hypothetical protein